MAIQFGLPGLLFFAIPNAIGLTAFGWFAQHISRKAESSVAFEKHFLRTVGNLRWIFLVYQVVAIALTFFAVVRYVFIPLGLDPYLIILLVLGLALLVGELCGIAQLKWWHLGFSAVIILSILLIGWGGASYFANVGITPRPFNGVESVIRGADEEGFIVNPRFIGFWVPILVGFLLGPWLDIQQWQRAIQIRREKTNIATSYTFGGLLFFVILLFHGTLALSIWGEGVRLGVTGEMVHETVDGLFHAKAAVVHFLFTAGVQDVPLLFRVMYVVFLCLCIISTLDSGYVALKWFQTDTIKKSDNILVALIPKSFLESPIPPFIAAAVVGITGLWTHWELEYYMAFYGSFSIGYSLVFLFRTTFQPRFAHFTQTTLVALAAISTGVFGIGYLEEIWFLMALGSLIPLVHAIVCIATRKAVEEIKRSGVMDKIAEGDYAGAVRGLRPQERSGTEGDDKREIVHVDSEADLSPAVSQVAQTGSSWIQGKWFVHSLTATYQDTNSVGNVYFAQYGMWVGKTRELFFHHCLPNFDLNTTGWYILTRSFEHKFMRETTEFEQIQIHIRVSDVSRKFVTMEHKIFDSAKQTLGKGNHVLFFVFYTDYRLIDIPGELHRAFLPYL